MTLSPRALDKFYTQPGVVEACLRDFHAWTGIAITSHPGPIIEPSAGAGAFLDALPDHAVGYDLHPEDPRILRQNFLALQRTEPAIVIGNPPFGRVSNLAVAFFNHAAGFASHIGFVVPRTFQKESVHNRLDCAFTLVGERVLDAQSFTFEGKPYAVPCVFQAWARTTPARTRSLALRSHPDFSFVGAPLADFAMQRIGVRAGTIKTNPHNLSVSSHYFIKAHADPHRVLARFQALDVDSVRHNTAGNPSISKAETVALYAQTDPNTPTPS